VHELPHTNTPAHNRTTHAHSALLLLLLLLLLQEHWVR
jgi:hypothetical protein